MSNKLDRIHEQGEAVIGEIVEAQSNDVALRNLSFQMGQLDAIHAIASNLNTGLIVRLQQIRDTKEYLAAGYERFDEFLDKFEHSPMSYKRFNYIENIFKGLGPDVFDLASASGLSVRQMKMLGKGNVEIEDGIVKVQVGDDVVETPIENKRQWLQTLKILADLNADKATTIGRQKEKIAKHDAREQDLQDELSRVRASKRAEVNDDPHSHAIVGLTFSFQNLTATVEDMSEIERQQFIDQDFRLIADLMSNLAAAYGRSDWTTLGNRSEAHNGDDIDAILDKTLDEEDGNTAELAARM